MSDTQTGRHAQTSEDKKLGSPGGNIALGIVLLVIGILARGHGIAISIPLIIGPIFVLYGIVQLAKGKGHATGTHR